ncbi:MAG: hypothetical protein QM586_04735 [Xenophilus sp.]
MIRKHLLASLPAALLAAGCALAPALLHAQSAPAATQAQPTESAPLDGRHNQKIEHITVEDKSARIEELRYGGRTQSITVQPKNSMPSYEVLPTNPARQGSADAGSDTGPRVWNVLKF